MFDSAFFKFITPLNFAFYNKFLLEEMIIYPIVAILQKSSKLIPIESVLHAYEKTAIQFKEFVLKPHNKTVSNHLCFVASPSNPYENSQ